MMRRFDFIFAFKNFRKPTTLISMVVSFIGVILLSVTLFVIPKQIEDAIIYMEETKYNNYEILIKADSSSSVRFFPTSEMETENFNIYIKDMVSFFNSSAVFSHEDKSYINDIYAGDINDLTNFFKIESKELGNSEIIISQENAKKNNYVIGDFINLCANETKYPLEIIEIIDDQGLMKDNTILMNKTRIATILGINPTFIDEKANLVYLDIYDEFSKQEVLDYLNNIWIDEALATSFLIPYRDFNLLIDDTFNQGEVDILIRSYKVSVNIISLFIILTIIVLINSLITKSLTFRKNDYEIIKLLGGSNKYFILIHLLEFLMYLFVSLGVSIIVAPVFFNFILKEISPLYEYHVDFQFVIGILIGVLMVILLLIFNYWKYFKKQNITIKRHHLALIFTSLFMVLFILMFIFDHMVLTIIFFLFMIITFIFIVEYLFKYTFKLFQKRKDFFGLFNARIMIDNSNQKHSLKLLLISFISIIFVLIFSSYITKQLTKTSDSFNFDYVIMNINRNLDFDTITLDEGSIEAHIYEHLRISEHESITMAMSLDYQNYEGFFNEILNDEVLIKMQSTTNAYILLPLRYKYVLNYQIGDIILLDLNKKYEDVPFEILDFIDHDYSFYCFTNIMNLDQFKEEGLSDFSANAILFKGNSPIFQSNIYQVIDKDVFLDSMVSSFTPIINVMLVVSALLVLLLIFVVMTNSQLLFLNLYPYYANVALLGMSKRKLRYMYYYECLVTFILLTFLTIIAIITIVLFIDRIILIFGIYSSVTITINDIINGSAICLVTFILSQLVFMIKISNFKMIDLLKIE